jgi:hypothetical protein
MFESVEKMTARAADERFVLGNEDFQTVAFLAKGLSDEK